jgi:hypothetical protein
MSAFMLPILLLSSLLGVHPVQQAQVAPDPLVQVLQAYEPADSVAFTSTWKPVTLWRGSMRMMLPPTATHVFRDFKDATRTEIRIGQLLILCQTGMESLELPSRIVTKQRKDMSAEVLELTLKQLESRVSSYKAYKELLLGPDLLTVALSTQSNGTVVALATSYSDYAKSPYRHTSFRADVHSADDLRYFLNIAARYRIRYD